MEERQKVFSMPKQLKEKWIEALRSGDYKQAESTLVAIVENEEGEAIDVEGYCCLGVLCKLCGIEDQQMQGCDIIRDLSKNVRQSVPEPFRNGEADVPEQLTGILTKMNDGYLDLEFFMQTDPELVWPKIPEYSHEKVKFSFKDIAQFIEDNVEGVEPQIEQLQASNDALNKALSERDERIYYLEKQFEYEKKTKESYIEWYEKAVKGRQEGLSLINTIYMRASRNSLFGNRKALKQIEADIKLFFKNLN